MQAGIVYDALSLWSTSVVSDVESGMSSYKALGLRISMTGVVSKTCMGVGSVAACIAFVMSLLYGLSEVEDVVRYDATNNQCDVCKNHGSTNGDDDSTSASRAHFC